MIELTEAAQELLDGPNTAYVATVMAEELLQGEAGEAIRAQSPFGRVAHPEEVAEVVAFLASSEGEFLSGSIVDVHGASYLRH